MKRSTYRSAIWVLLSLTAFTHSAFGQCDDKTGFAKKACEVESGNVQTLGSDAMGLKSTAGSALTTGFADTIHPDTLPPAMEPKAYVPLVRLNRTDDGSFLLKPGIYEAYLESFSLDAGSQGGARIGGYFPAPLKGLRAKIIAEALKNAELHPEVTQSEIQQLLFALVQNADLEKMPPAVQQTAARLLSKEALTQLKGATASKAVENKLLGLLNRRLANNPQAAHTAADARNLDQNLDISNTIREVTAANNTVELLAAVGPVLRGTWAQMPGGFYVRYLPEGVAKIRVQIMVPDAAVEKAEPKSPLAFDPTQYLAVLAGVPPQRLGITLRPAR